MRISNLSNKSGNPSSSDYLVLDDGTTVTKIDYNKLAKAIIENYAGSTVAGAAQSVKAALDSLNSNSIFAVTANVSRDDDLNNYTTPGVYNCSSSTVATTLSNKPSAVTTGFKMIVVPTGYGQFVAYGLQIILMGSGSSVPRIYFRSSLNGSWSSWRSIDTTEVS